MILGIDEAGRGAVIGPMVIAGVLVEDQSDLVEIGVRDSKELSPEQRKELYSQILSTVKDFVVIKLPAFKIDEMRKRYSLNYIETIKMAEIINILKPSRVFVDCPYTSPTRFISELQALLKHSPEVIAEHKADSKYPVVAAASIIAKVERDREIEMLKEKLGMDFGVGYPHDPRTVELLKKLSPNYPEFVRKSWLTACEIAESKKQKTLGDFE